MSKNFANILPLQTHILTDINLILGNQILDWGIDPQTFVAINGMKQTILLKLSSQELSAEETAIEIMELIDQNVKDQIEAVIDTSKGKIEEVKSQMDREINDLLEVIEQGENQIKELEIQIGKEKTQNDNFRKDIDEHISKIEILKNKNDLD